MGETNNNELNFETLTLDDPSTKTQQKTPTQKVVGAINQVITNQKSLADKIKGIVEGDEAVIPMIKGAVEQLETQFKDVTEKMKTVQIMGTNGRTKATHGFKSMGEFAMSVKGAFVSKFQSVDERLTKAAASTIAGTTSGEDGGYLIPEEFSSEILAHAFDDQAIASRCRNMTLSGDSISMVRDESTPYDGTGIQTYWVDDTDAIPQSKPKFKKEHIDLYRLASLVPVSDTQLADARALGSHIMSNAPMKIRYDVDSSIINGNGVGKPLGILSNSNAALVSVGKDSGQPADSLTVSNLANMFARMPASSIGNAVWLMNQDVLPKLLTLTVGNVPVYLAGGYLSNAPMGTVLGRPVIFCESCQTLGDKGDVIFVDLSAYLLSTKAGGIETAQSMHLWFDQALTAFRFIYRVNGQPWPKAPIPPKNGSADRSYFVTLDARA